ncbi:MAG: hypothetical protein ACRYFU_25965 [Janthinobacterium lividum]
MNVRSALPRIVRALAPLAAVIFIGSLTMHFVHHREDDVAEEKAIHQAYDSGRIARERWISASPEWRRGFNASDHSCNDLYTGRFPTADNPPDAAFLAFDKSDLVRGCSDGKWATEMTSHMKPREYTTYELGIHGLSR